MEYKIEASSTRTRKFLDALMPSMIEQLGLTNSRRAVLVKVTADTPNDFHGATLHMEFADCYLVLIRPPKRLTELKLLDMATTLAHEMVHVRQMALGILKVVDGKNYWKGKRYTKRTKYLDQPWGCGSRPASGLSREDMPRPAVGTTEEERVGLSLPLSRVGGLPLIRSLISSPDRVSYSSRP